jgi:hypothetical protein
MQFGKSLVGGIIGGLLGIAALIAVQWLTGYDRTWLAILVAFLTGAGVRTMVSTAGHASYLRGALTALLALAAYAGGTSLYAKVAQNFAAPVQASISLPVAEPADKEAAEEVVEEAPVAPVAAPPAIAPRDGAMTAKPQLPQNSSPWDFAWLTIAALLAYELGRGSSAPAVPQQEIIPPPDAT